MAYIRGEAREQTTMFPVTLDELIPADHVCRVIEAFVGRLNMARLGFVRAEPAETGRPGYDPRDLLKLYLYGYLHAAARFGLRLCRHSKPVPRDTIVVGSHIMPMQYLLLYRRLH